MYSARALAVALRSPTRHEVAKAKAAGVCKGRKPSINVNEVRRLKNVEGMGATEITRELGIARTSVYRVLENS